MVLAVLIFIHCNNLNIYRPLVGGLGVLHGFQGWGIIWVMRVLVLFYDLDTTLPHLWISDNKFLVRRYSKGEMSRQKI